MSDDVQFDTDTQLKGMRRVGPQPSFGQAVPETSGMAGWLIRHRLAKTAGGAQVFLMAIFIVDIIAAFLVVKLFVL